MKKPASSGENFNKRLYELKKAEPLPKEKYNLREANFIYGNVITGRNRTVKESVADFERIRNDPTEVKKRSDEVEAAYHGYGSAQRVSRRGGEAGFRTRPVVKEEKGLSSRFTRLPGTSRRYYDKEADEIISRRERDKRAGQGNGSKVPIL